MKLKTFTLLVISSFGLSASLLAQPVVFLTGTNSIGVITNPLAPQLALGPFPVSGINAGETLVGMDFRPLNGQLIALGYDNNNGNATLYSINQMTAAATAINMAPMTLSLVPGEVGFDFNPTVDRIRVISSNGMNYRLNPLTGTVAFTDGALNYAVNDVNFGAAPDVVAGAYTNSYLGTETTLLYDMDATLNIIATQNPPNSGVLNTTTGTSVSINPADKSCALDIYFNPVTLTNSAYFVGNNGNSTNDTLYGVNLTTGVFTALGAVGTGVSVWDIAVQISPVTPTNNGQLIYGLTRNAGAGNLISFDSQNPRAIQSLVPVSGITAGQTTVGMDFRPATKELFVMGYEQATDLFQLYKVNTATGVATAVGIADTIGLDTTRVGFDFNPTVDRIRVVGSNGANYRVNPNDGIVVATDLVLDFATGDINENAIPDIATVAYTNSYTGSTSTTLYGYDDVLNTLVTIAPPNNGILNTLGTSGFTVNPADKTTDMDIYYDSVSNSNLFYFISNNGSATNDSLYTITGTNTFTGVGSIGLGIPVKDIAVIIGGTPLMGIEEQEEGFLNLFPNPASDIAYLTLKSTKGISTVQIEVWNFSGQLVQQFNTAATDMYTLNIQGIASGIYTVKVWGDGQVIGSKLLVKP